MKSSIIVALTMAVVVNTFAQQVLYCAGTVRYASGAPAANVAVEYCPGHHEGAGKYAEVRTDANGRYQIVGPADKDTYWGEISETNCIMARDVERNLAAFQEFHMSKTNVDLILQPAITLSGSVNNPEGEPIVDAELHLSFVTGSYHKLEAKRTKVNELGQFSVSALPQGCEYDIVRIAAKGYGSDRGLVEARDTKTNHYEFPTFVLKRADRKIAGRVVVNGDGKPPLGAVTVYFTGKGQPMNSEDKWGQQSLRNTKTDAEGQFSFDTVCDGALRVYADFQVSYGFSVHLNGGRGMEVKAGDTNIVINLSTSP